MSSDRVLIWLKPNYLGDAVMATPLIDEMIRLTERPAVLAGKGVMQVLSDRADQVEFIAAGDFNSPLGLMRQARDLRKRRLTTGLIVNRSFRSALAARAAGLTKRVGHASEGRSIFLTQAIPYDKGQFEAESYLDLARAAGFEAVSRRPSLKVSAAEQEWGATRLSTRCIGIQPGARYESKQIPIGVTAEVAKHLARKGYQIALLGGKEEAIQGQEVRRAAPDVEFVDLIGATAIRETMGVLANLELMVGSDTGLMHLAAAIGRPTITVFGPNPISKWGHHYEPHRPLLAPDGDIRFISAEAILGAADELLSA